MPYTKPTLQYKVRCTMKKEVICLLLVILMALILFEDLHYVTPRSAAVSTGASAESPVDISLAALNPLLIQYQLGLTSSRAVTQTNHYHRLGSIPPPVNSSCLIDNTPPLRAVAIHSYTISASKEKLSLSTIKVLVEALEPLQLMALLSLTYFY